MAMRGRWVGWWLGVALSVLAGTVVVAGWSATRPVSLRVGAGDQRFFSGMYAVENGHRWTTKNAQLRVPTVRDDARVIVLALQNGYLPEMTAPTVTVAVGRTGSAAWVVEGARVYQLLGEPHRQWRWDRPVDITTTTQTIGADGRALGVVFHTIESRPTTLSQAAGLAYPLGVALLAATVVFLFAALCEATPRRAAGIALGALGLWWAGLWWAPLSVWPATWWFVAGAWIALAATAVAWVLRTVRHSGQPLRVGGADLPVWFAVAWWAIPFVQQVLSADNVYIRVYDYEPWMGWLAGVGVALAVAVRWGAPVGTLRARVAQWLPVVVVAILAVAYQSTVFGRIFKYGSGDFSIWVDAATRWVTTGRLYLIDNVADNPFAGYKRPPFYIMLFTPFVGMDTKTILDGFRLVNIVLFLATAAVWIRSIAPTRTIWWLLVLGALANYQPLVETITYGQTDVILLACMTVVWWAARRGRDGWAGVVVALLTSLKIYPILLLAFFVIKRRWWAIVGFVAGMLLWNGIAVAVMGWDLHWTYLSKVVGHVGGTTAWIENQTIAGFITRFYETPLVMSRFGDAGIARVASLISYAVSAVVCLLALKETPAQSSATALQYGLFVLLMVLAIPVAWMHYYTLMLLVFWMVVWHHRDHTLSLRRAGAYAVAYAFIAYGNYKSFNYPDDFGAITLLLGSYKLYAIVLLYVLVVSDIMRTPGAWATGWLAVWDRLRTRVRWR